MTKKKAEEKKSANDVVSQLLAMDANIPPETVPTMLKAMEDLKKDMKMVDNHLLILARSAIERTAAVKKAQRAERRAAMFKWTFGLVGRACKAVGSTAATIVTAPVKLARAKISGKPAKEKKATRTRRSSKKTDKKADAKPAAATA